jgi:hypothetical protein
MDPRIETISEKKLVGMRMKMTFAHNKYLLKQKIMCYLPFPHKILFTVKFDKRIIPNFD